MEIGELNNIIKNHPNRIKYYRTLESAYEVALNITALANTGGGFIIIGVKNNYTSIELKGIGLDFNINKTFNELTLHCDKDIFKITQHNMQKKMIIVIEVKLLKSKTFFKGRRYIMDKNMQPVILKEKIFISHSSKDKQYGEALVKLLRGLGLKRDQIIFTSNDDYGIPIDMNIFEYLKKQINEGAYMIYLLSNDYYGSVACLNEMGAAWVVQNDYTVIGIPGFHFDNPKFLNGAIDPRRIGFTIDNKKRIVEFKNKLLERLQLEVDEADWNRILEEHIASL